MKTIDSPPPSESLIDTSKMLPGQKAALEMAEAAREERTNAGLAASLFFGTPNFSQLVPFARQRVEDRDQGDAFLSQLRGVLAKHADPDAIDRDGEIPDELISALAQIGAFGIKIPVAYGGLGLSQTNYSRAAMLLGGEDGNLAALLSAHQSIGAPQPLILFGTEEQKAKYLPRCARGEIS
ncbi:MAG TPA: acyl-CoA dehydrogenase family protein, partial [Prosthecobacter sp.]|nr:acyl-CoA dehydrogenase family protein [Prosthecobacter sp.]